MRLPSSQSQDTFATLWTGNITVTLTTTTSAVGTDKYWSFSGDQHADYQCMHHMIHWLEWLLDRDFLNSDHKDDWLWQRRYTRSKYHICFTKISLTPCGPLRIPLLQQTVPRNSNAVPYIRIWTLKTVCTVSWGLLITQDIKISFIFHLNWATVRRN